MLVSSVRGDADDLLTLAPKASTRIALNRNLSLPIQNHYQTPDTLGMDRLAGACGAHALFPTQNCLVIDAGTCVTFDFVDGSGVYYGGGISPGLHMRFKAMHTFTAKLPLISPKAGVPLIGASTEASMQSGVVNGMIAEMEGIIARYAGKYAELRVILCGGDAGFFENQLKASIFASPELVLIGLNSILIHNVNQK
jgi:type III pantothenate kinase